MVPIPPRRLSGDVSTEDTEVKLRPKSWIIQIKIEEAVPKMDVEKAQMQNSRKGIERNPAYTNRKRCKKNSLSLDISCILCKTMKESCELGSQNWTVITASKTWKGRPALR